MNNYQEFQPIFSMDQVPHEVLGIKLTDESRRLLSFGHSSELLENVEVEPGIIRDTKIKLFLDKRKNVTIGFDHKHPELVIPKEILGCPLTEKIKKDLVEGKTVGPIKANNDLSVYLKIDKELNRITVSTDKELGILDVIGKHKLTDIDKNRLANGEPTPPRVLIDPEGKAFLASISITPDKKGIVFESIKEINKSHIEELTTKYNQDPAPKIMAFEKLKGEIDGEFTMLYVGKDQDGNLYQCSSGIDLLISNENNWSKLDPETYNKYKEQLHTIELRSPGEQNVSNLTNDQSSLIKALNEGKYVYFQEESGKAIQIENSSDLTNARAQGIDQFEIFEKRIENANTYSETLTAQAINIGTDNPLSPKEQQIFDEIKKGNLNALASLSQGADISPNLINKISNERELNTDTKISALTLLKVKDPATTLAQHQLSKKSLHSNLESDLKIDKDLDSNQKSSNAGKKIAQALKGAESTANKLFGNM